MGLPAETLAFCAETYSSDFIWTDRLWHNKFARSQELGFWSMIGFVEMGLMSIGGIRPGYVV
jgi:hypothetical protein